VEITMFAIKTPLSITILFPARVQERESSMTPTSSFLQECNLLCKIVTWYLQLIDSVVLNRPSYCHATEDQLIFSNTKLFPQYIGVTCDANLQTASESPFRQCQHEGLHEKSDTHSIHRRFRENFVHANDSTTRRSEEFVVSHSCLFGSGTIFAWDVVPVLSIQEVAELASEVCKLLRQWWDIWALRCRFRLFHAKRA
jgi:hypothetical protein